MANPTIAQLRTWVLANAFEDPGDAAVDNAWRVAIEELLRYAPCITRVWDNTTLSVTTGDASIDFTDIQTKGGWYKDRFVFAWLDGKYELRECSEVAIRTRQRYDSTSGRPELICFLTDTDTIIYPTADADYTLTVVYDETLLVRNGSTLVSWVDGTSAGASTYTINVDERWARHACFRGAPSVLQHGDPAARFTSNDWQYYARWCMEQKVDGPEIAQLKSGEYN